MENKKLTGYPSIDKPWLKYYTDEAINAPLPDGTIYEYLWQNNKDHLDDIALKYYDRTMTYRDFVPRNRLCRQRLRSLRRRNR